MTEQFDAEDPMQVGSVLNDSYQTEVDTLWIKFQESSKQAASTNTNLRKELQNQAKSTSPTHTCIQGEDNSSCQYTGNDEHYDMLARNDSSKAIAKQIKSFADIDLSDMRVTLLESNRLLSFARQVHRDLAKQNASVSMNKKLPKLNNIGKVRRFDQERFLLNKPDLPNELKKAGKIAEALEICRVKASDNNLRIAASTETSEHMSDHRNWKSRIWQLVKENIGFVEDFFWWTFISEQAYVRVALQLVLYRETHGKRDENGSDYRQCINMTLRDIMFGSGYSCGMVYDVLRNVQINDDYYTSSNGRRKQNGSSDQIHSSRAWVLWNAITQLPQHRSEWDVRKDDESDPGIAQLYERISSRYCRIFFDATAIANSISTTHFGLRDKCCTFVRQLILHAIRIIYHNIYCAGDGLTNTWLSDALNQRLAAYFDRITSNTELMPSSAEFSKAAGRKVSAVKANPQSDSKLHQSQQTNARHKSEKSDCSTPNRQHQRSSSITSFSSLDTAESNVKIYGISVTRKALERVIKRASVPDRIHMLFPSEQDVETRETLPHTPGEALHSVRSSLVTPNSLEKSCYTSRLPSSSTIRHPPSQLPCFLVLEALWRDANVQLQSKAKRSHSDTPTLVRSRRQDHIIYSPAVTQKMMRSSSNTSFRHAAQHAVGIHLVSKHLNSSANVCDNDSAQKRSNLVSQKLDADLPCYASTIEAYIEHIKVLLDMQLQAREQTQTATTLNKALIDAVEGQLGKAVWDEGARTLVPSGRRMSSVSNNDLNKTFLTAVGTNTDRNSSDKILASDIRSTASELHSQHSTHNVQQKNTKLSVRSEAVSELMNAIRRQRQFKLRNHQNDIRYRAKSTLQRSRSTTSIEISKVKHEQHQMMSDEAEGLALSSKITEQRLADYAMAELQKINALPKFARSAALNDLKVSKALAPWISARIGSNASNLLRANGLDPSSDSANRANPTSSNLERAKELSLRLLQFEQNEPSIHVKTAEKDMRTRASRIRKQRQQRHLFPRTTRHRQPGEKALDDEYDTSLRNGRVTAIPIRHVDDDDADITHSKIEITEGSLAARPDTAEQIKRRKQRAAKEEQRAREQRQQERRNRKLQLETDNPSQHDQANGGQFSRVEMIRRLRQSSMNNFKVERRPIDYLGIQNWSRQEEDIRSNISALGVQRELPVEELSLIRRTVEQRRVRDHQDNLRRERALAALDKFAPSKAPIAKYDATSGSLRSNELFGVTPKDLAIRAGYLRCMSQQLADNASELDVDAVEAHSLPPMAKFSSNISASVLFQNSHL